MLRLAPRPIPDDPVRFVHPSPSVLEVERLRVVATHVPGDDIVDVRLVWPVGYAHEDTIGVGEFLARSLGTSTARRDPYELACATEQLGASIAAEVTAEATVVRVDAVHTHVIAALRLALEGLVAPDLASVDRLRSEAIDARRRALADPRTRGRETLFAAIHAGTAFARSRSASVAALQAVTAADLGRHMALLRGLRPTVVVTGNLQNIALHTVVKAVEQRLGVQNGPGELPNGVLGPAARKPRRMIVHRPGAVQSLVHLGHLAPPRAHPEHASLLVGVSTLGGAFTSRLNLRLREELGITYGARAHVVARRATGAILLEAAVERDATVCAVDESLAVLRRQLSGGVTHEELRDTRTWLLRRAPQRYQTVSQTADAIAGALALGITPHELGCLDDEIASTSREGVANAMRSHVHPDELDLVVVGDADQLADDITEQHGAVEIIDGPVA